MTPTRPFHQWLQSTGRRPVVVAGIQGQSSVGWRDVVSEDSTKLTELRLILIDYATMAFVFMSVAFGPTLVWTLVWMAAR
jgi:hypothetical protein